MGVETLDGDVSTMITGINPVRNCIENGYPIIESILTKYPICEAYYVNDGGSTDGTLEALEELAEVYPRIKIYNVPDIRNVRWDSCTKQVNHMIKETRTPWIYLDNADEAFHEQDVAHVKKELATTPHRIMRYPRREIIHNWSQLSKDVYYPGRAAQKMKGLYMDWNPYGGDEFLYDDGWHDPLRHIKSKIPLYHLLNVFPENKMTKLRHDAEYIAPGDKIRVRHYESMKPYSFSYTPPTNVYPRLPGLVKELVGQPKYRARKELYDINWVEQTTGLSYST